MDHHLKLFTGRLVLRDRVLESGALLVRGNRIAEVGLAEQLATDLPADVPHINAAGGYITPGYIDLHVHGGQGADFMDGTEDAFQTVVSAHAQHGTTGIVPTTTVGSHERLLTVLDLCRKYHNQPQRTRARVLGCHFYGPYFGYEARGCHPGEHVRPPEEHEYEEYLDRAEAIVTATVAPELPGAEAFARACAEAGVRTNVGHSHATFEQMVQAVEWGVRHVDHLFCAMSDKSKLRQKQAYPMQGGVLEATLYFDELTTEIIADGKHLTRDLLLLALKLKGADRLALVTDCNRALDLPDGEYVFGPLDGGEPFVRRDDVGVMPDGAALASSVMGMDHMVCTFARMTERPVWEVVRLATETPARIAGWHDSVGSLRPGLLADLLVLDDDLQVQRVFVDGQELTWN